MYLLNANISGARLSTELPGEETFTGFSGLEALVGDLGTDIDDMPDEYEKVGTPHHIDGVCTVLTWASNLMNNAYEPSYQDTLKCCCVCFSGSPLK